jgi:hypothetical protein
MDRVRLDLYRTLVTGSHRVVVISSCCTSFTAILTCTVSHEEGSRSIIFYSHIPPRTPPHCGPSLTSSTWRTPVPPSPLPQLSVPADPHCTRPSIWVLSQWQPHCRWARAVQCRRRHSHGETSPPTLVPPLDWGRKWNPDDPLALVLMQSRECRHNTMAAPPRAPSTGCRCYEPTGETSDQMTIANKMLHVMLDLLMVNFQCSIFWW